MGNILGRTVQAPQWEPNILPEIQQQNNPNLPYQEQMRAMVLQYAVPMLCLSVIGKLVGSLTRTTTKESFVLVFHISQTASNRKRKWRYFCSCAGTLWWFCKWATIKPCTTSTGCVVGDWIICKKKTTKIEVLKFWLDALQPYFMRYWNLRRFLTFSFLTDIFGWFFIAGYIRQKQRREQGRLLKQHQLDLDIQMSNLRNQYRNTEEVEQRHQRERDSLVKQHQVELDALKTNMHAQYHNIEQHRQQEWEKLLKQHQLELHVQKSNLQTQYQSIEQRYQQERESLLKEHQLELDVQKNNLQAQYQKALDDKLESSSKMQAAILAMEQQRAEKRHKELDGVERWLEEILDIRCSRFKDHKQREKLQHELIAKRESLTIADIVSYKELIDVYKYDGLFCGNNRRENGKLRQLYMQQWRLKVEVDRAQTILRKLENSNR